MGRALRTTPIPVRVTLDTNCLIDLEVESVRTNAVHGLVQRFRNSEFQLCIPAISASERTESGRYLLSIADFEDRLARLGLQRAEHLLPMLYLDVCFPDHGLLSDVAMLTLERKLHQVLHPTVAFEYQEYCVERGLDPNAVPSDRKWRNAKCDVQVAWAHIWHGADVLVTADGNFLKPTKLPKLLALGAKRISLPQNFS